MKQNSTVLNFFESHKYKENPRDNHLFETPLCDFSDPKIKAIVKDIEGAFSNPNERLTAAYDFIRQNIKYGFDIWPRNASETVDLGYGMCFNKTNLMVAILRSLGIPSQYCVIWIRREAFVHTIGLELLPKVQPETVHVYGEAYDEESKEWRVLIDTSIDVKLRRVLDRLGHDPNQHIITTKPIERYSTPEEVVNARKRFKKLIGAEDVITEGDMGRMNARLEELRKNL